MLAVPHALWADMRTVEVVAESVTPSMRHVCMTPDGVDVAVDVAIESAMPRGKPVAISVSADPLSIGCVRSTCEYRSPTRPAGISRSANTGIVHAGLRVIVTGNDTLSPPLSTVTVYSPAVE